MNVSYREPPRDGPRGDLVGTVDEYGTVWDGEPGAQGSNPIGDLVMNDDGETGQLYIIKVADRHESAE